MGQSINTPQTTEQHKYQFRDDFTFSKGRHEFKVGASFINEPTLDITFSTGQQPQFTHLADSRTSPISNITLQRLDRRIGAAQRRDHPEQAIRVLHPGRVARLRQADPRPRRPLRLRDRVRVRPGQATSSTRRSRRPPSAACSAPSALPCPCPGFEDFGKSPKEDTNNIAPRAGFTYDVKGDGSFVFRGGVGRYYDFAYTNANILFAVVGAQSSFGQIYLTTTRRASATPTARLYQVGQPLPPNQLTNAARAASRRTWPRRGRSSPTPTRPTSASRRPSASGFAIEVDGVYRGRQGPRHPPGAEPPHQRRRPPLRRHPGPGSPAPRTSASTSWRAPAATRAITFAIKKHWDGKLQLAGVVRAVRHQVVGQPARHRRVRRIRSHRPVQRLRRPGEPDALGLPAPRHAPARSGRRARASPSRRSSATSRPRRSTS